MTTTPRQRRVPQRPPWPLVALAVLGAAVFVVPLAGLASRTPWLDLPDLLASDVVVDALRLSLITSVVAAVISVILGVPLAWVLARVEFPGRSLVRAIVTLPMVLPPVVGGAALLFALGRSGLIGEPLDDATGFLLPFSIWGVIVANTFVAMPFLVITVEGALSGVDRRYEAAAATLGGEPTDRVSAGDAADDRPVAARRRRAGLGASTGRVRGHHHLRRQPPGPHPDPAARGVRRPRIRS